MENKEFQVITMDDWFNKLENDLNKLDIDPFNTTHKEMVSKMICQALKEYNNLQNVLSNASKGIL